MAKRPKGSKNFIFSIQVEENGDDEESARLELARKLKRSAIQIVTGLELVATADGEVVTPVEKEETVVRRSQTMEFNQLPTALKTNYWKRRNDINEIWQDKDKAFNIRFGKQLDTWTMTPQGWKRETVMV